jgi:hypothetical protein
MVSRSSDSPGRARISRRTIAQGRPECFRFTCMLMCVFFRCTLHMRPRVQRAPGLPCALFFRGEVILQASDKTMSRERRIMSQRHCAEPTGRARIRAVRWLAMTLPIVVPAPDAQLRIRSRGPHSAHALIWRFDSTVSWLEAGTTRTLTPAPIVIKHNYS